MWQGVDLRNETQMSSIWPYISNQEAIRVNDQWVGDPGRLLDLTQSVATDKTTSDVDTSANTVEVWAKLQPDGAVALLAINLNATGDAEVVVNLSEVVQQMSIPIDENNVSPIPRVYKPLHSGWCDSRPCAIRDIW